MERKIGGKVKRWYWGKEKENRDDKENRWASWEAQNEKGMTRKTVGKVKRWYWGKEEDAGMKGYQRGREMHLLEETDWREARGPDYSLQIDIQVTARRVSCLRGWRSLGGGVKGVKLPPGFFFWGRRVVGGGRVYCRRPRFRLKPLCTIYGRD